jgi:hypothetical protein
LKKLNVAHLNTPYFHMETVEDVRHALRPGDWVASIDLRDAYFHVPLHHSTKKYMCFGWRGRLNCFCVLPFGLSPALKVFTALTRFIKVHFRSLSSVLGRTARGILIYSLVAFLPCFGLSAAQRGKLALLFPVVLKWALRPLFSTGLPLAIRPCF